MQARRYSMSYFSRRNEGFLFLDFAIEGDRHLFEGNVFPGGCEGLACSHDDSAAAGDLHAEHRHTLYGGDPEEFGQLIGVETVVVKLGAADDERFPGEKVAVEIR